MTKEEKTEEQLKWELTYKKKRIFVRELSGKYGELYRQLLEQPRVYKSKSMPFMGGPQKWSKTMLDPHTAAVTQAFHIGVDVFAPGGYGQKHGHMNSAIFYILEGKGYDIHDGIRYDWEAGDACIVENGCVHQHFNADPNRPARVLIMKGKPAFLFFNLIFQKFVEEAPKEPIPGFEDFWPAEQ